MRLVDRPSLAALTTLGLGGTCARMAVIEEAADLAELAAVLAAGPKPYVLGMGSNVMGQDGHHDITLVRCALRGEPEVIGEEGTQLLVRCPAGLPLPSLLARCRKEGWSGLEGLAGIPGSVGGAVAMNAGSFGSVTGGRLVSADIWHEGRAWTFPVERISLGYRHFAPPGLENAFYIVTGCVLRLDRDDPAAVAGRVAAAYAAKRERQPVGARSAGCVFKNPGQGMSAGARRDRAGFRGRRLGGVELSPVHANFLVNLGSGTAAEAAELLGAARRAVAERFGVSLEMEVRGIPCPCL